MNIIIHTTIKIIFLIMYLLIIINNLKYMQTEVFDNTIHKVICNLKTLILNCISKIQFKFNKTINYNKFFCTSQLSTKSFFRSHLLQTHFLSICTKNSV